MDINKIHFIREILVMDHQGKTIPSMQFSYDNASYLQPSFMNVPSTDQAQVRKLYEQLGGGRHEGWWSGSTVIIPNRSFWANLWGISADEVQVMTSDEWKSLKFGAHTA
jgi:hypothetical protein